MTNSDVLTETTDDDLPELAEATNPPNGSRHADLLFGALAQAQGEFGVPKRSRKVTVKMQGGGSYDYLYATLDDIVAAIRKPLADHGLSFTQPATTDQNTVSVRTRLMHESGQWFEVGPFVLPTAGGAQAYGSALTYARRYALTSTLGIVTEDDDDARSAGTNGAPAVAGSTGDRSPKASDAQMRKMHALAKEKGITHEQMTDWAGRHLGIESLTELTKLGATAVIDALNNLPDAEAASGADLEDPGPAPDSQGP